MSTLEINVENLSDPRIAVTKRCPLSFMLVPGKLHVIVGANGSGKSTLIDLLAIRTYPSRASMISRAGHSNSTDVAYLPQRVFDAYDLHLSSLASLAGLRSPHTYGIADDSRPLRRRKSRDLGQLSGGERQLYLFQLVTNQPQCVHMYDEPFRHLDSSSRNYVNTELSGLVVRGQLVVVVDHEDGLRDLTVPLNPIDLTKPCCGHIS